MKGFIHFLFVSCLLVTVSANATAANYPDIYVTAGVGATEALDMPDSSDYANVNGSDSSDLGMESDDYGVRLALGLIWNQDRFVSPGLEVGVAYYGRYQYSSESTSLETYYYGVEYLGMLQFNLKNLKLIAKAGFVDQSSDVSTEGFSNNDLDSDNSFDPEVAAGIGYRISSNAQLNAMYYHIYGDDVSFTNATEANNLPSFDNYFVELSYFF